MGDPTTDGSGHRARLTRDLIEAGHHLKIVAHDHIIVGSQGRSSLKALGLI
jgi:DNA repair protein RadC